MKATSTGFQSFSPRGQAPATYAIIALSLVVFVLSWLMRGKFLEPLMFWNDATHLWGLVTYPFASGGNGLGLFWYLIQLWWFYWVGTSAERDLGTTKYLSFFFAESILAVLAIWLGLVLMLPDLTGPVVGGLELPIAALTVAWGVRHRNEPILLFAIIPIPGWLLAWLTVALTLFGFGSLFHAPLMGAFACVHLAVAYLFATNKIPGVYYASSVKPVKAVKATERMDKKYYDDVKRREKDREERERLRKLFEGSMGDSSDEGK